MRPDGAVLDLSPGAVVVLDGRQWTVQLREPHLGRIVLAGTDGAKQQVSMQFLASHPGCFTSSRTAAPGAGRGRQEAGLGDLAPGRRELAELRQAHLLEVATGFRSGSNLLPRPGEPKPEYDPDATTLTQRRHAKAAELAALDPEQARLLGLDHVGYRTLIRWENGRRRAGLVGCADDRWLRESGGHPSVTEQIREAMLMVREQTRHRSRVTMKTRHVLACQYMRETFGAEAGFPSYRTFCRVWREWFGPGGARPRNDGSDGLPAKAGRIVVSRPGQDAFEPSARAFRRTAGPHSSKAPAQTTRFGADHIPAFLEQPWFEDHLARLECGSTVRSARRIAAATLVQWAAGGSIGDAAHYLGFNPGGGQYAPTSDLARWLAALGPDRFTRALRELALQLGRTPGLVNYQHRRQALRDWALTPGEWEHIASRLPPASGPVQPILDDRKRQESSAFIWARVTQGEPRFAPRPLEASQPAPVRKEWASRRASTWHKLIFPGRFVHYAELRHLLIEHSDQLARDIDNQL